MKAKPLAKADRPRKGPFAELLVQCEHDGDALQGLALAYYELSKLDRRKLIAVVAQETREPQNVLAAFLAIEDDVELARVLAGELSARGVRRTECNRWATLHDRGADGEARLVQRLHGPFAEVLCVTWRDHVIENVTVEPFVHVNEATPTERVRVDHTLKRIAPLLWRHARDGGALPAGAERFAEWF